MATGSAAEKRLFLEKLARARDDAEGGSTGRIVARTTGFLAILALLSGLGLWIGGFFSTPKEVLEIRALVDTEIAQLQLVSRNEAPLTFDSQSFRQSWDRMRDMPPAARDQARREMDRLFQAREQAELRSYFSLPPQERQKELDRRIKAEEARRQSRQRSSPVAAAAGAGSRAGSGSGGSGGSSAQGRGGPGGGGPSGGAGGPPGGQSGGRRRGSEDDRNLRSKQRIDSTSPTERAQSAEYRRAMEARRAQLGISPGRSRGG